MNHYVGILLDFESPNNSYFNHHMNNFIQCFESYDQLLMHCDESFSHLLVPSSNARNKDILYIAEKLHIQVFEYFFSNDTIHIYKLVRTSLDAVLQLDSESFLNIQRKNQQLHIALSDILYIESRKNSIYIYTIHEELQIRMRLVDVLLKLNHHYFFRCHQSYIVNMKFVYSLKRYEIIMIDGACIPVSKAYSKATRQFYHHLFNIG